jgi:hypothetical protein
VGVGAGHLVLRRPGTQLQGVGIQRVYAVCLGRARERPLGGPSRGGARAEISSATLIRRSFDIWGASRELFGLQEGLKHGHIKVMNLRCEREIFGLTVRRRSQLRTIRATVLEHCQQRVLDGLALGH